MSSTVLAPELGADDTADPKPPPRPRFWIRWDQSIAGALQRLREPETVVTLIVVLGIALYTFYKLEPSQLFKNTTPAGGDMGAHVWLPQFVKSHLLPEFRLTGWTPDQYDGFPALTYYFPLPIWAIALISYVIPYDIAFKLVSVAGLVSLPICAAAFGRLARIRFPGPAVLAAATLPYLFSREFTIYGGNIASTMAGEFSFSISLSFALLFLGVVARGLDTGRNRALAAGLLAGCAFSHILPLVFAVVGAIVLFALRSGRARLKWIVPVLVVGGLVTAVWSLPFEFRLPYATNMGYQKVTTYLTTLFPPKDIWLFVLAGIGATLSGVRRNRIGVWLTIMTVLSALVFRYAPQARLWNARVLPFWFLCLYLLAGLAVGEAGSLLADRVRETELRRVLICTVAVATALVAWVWTAFPLGDLPGEQVSASGGKYSFLGFSTKSPSFVPDWVYWNYSGYQNPGKAREQEYFALVNEMKKLGNDPAYGCGRAMWEYEPELDQMGTPDALMLLPYWTNGCIGSQEGLYYESSATTPYHFLNAAELSSNPSNPMRGLAYPSGIDVQEGVQHLQMLGVKYFMADTADVEREADADNQLTRVARVGPYSYAATHDCPNNASSCTLKATWSIYKVAASAEVTPLVDQPVVVKGVSSADSWLTASEAWYLDPSRWNVYLAASGPKGWARVPSSDTHPPVTPLPPVQISNIHEGTESISFNVNRTGVPVLVKTSYYPNWQASGASGVYRVTPNLMVVVPTADHVTLNYGYTPLDWVGFILTLLGLAGLVALWRLAPVVYPVRRPPRTGQMWYPGLTDDWDPLEPADGAVLRQLDEPYNRLADALADHLPSGLGGPAGDVDTWLGQPAGLELARFRVAGAAGLARPERGDAASPEAPSGVPNAPQSAATLPTRMTDLDRVFKAYDIRGVVPDELDVDLVRRIGWAFARFSGASRILVARDMRPSGVELAAAFADGVTSAGVDVVDLGLTSTDELYFAAGFLDAPGAMFTASHNPAQYNGIKLCLAGARPVGADTGLADIRADVESGDPPSPAATAGSVSTLDVLADYATKVRSFVDGAVLRPLKVVADTANGMGGLVVPAVFAPLPFDLEMLFPELDGTFPNHPADPIQPANLVDLQQRVRETGADIGLAFDGDADRCFLVDDRGDPVSGSTTTAIVAAAMLERYPGAIILYNVICSKAVPEIVQEHGGVAVKTRVGHSYIKSLMAETGAVFGGEHSGHYYFRDNYRADSGSIAALVVLELLSKAGRPLSELRRDYERYADSGEINTEVADPAAMVERLAEVFAGRYPMASQDRMDGLTVDAGSWWFNVRPSNTEPLLRLNVEAGDAAACQARVDEVVGVLRDEEARDEEARDEEARDEEARDEEARDEEARDEEAKEGQ